MPQKKPKLSEPACEHSLVSHNYNFSKDEYQHA